jgi:hypothetical protein
VVYSACDTKPPLRRLSKAFFATVADSLNITEEVAWTFFDTRNF